MSETDVCGHVKSSFTCHWRVPQWSELRLGVEYSSPPLYFDDLKWSIKIYKGKAKSPDMLSVYVQMHETSPGSLRGIRKNVQLALKINNTNPSSYYNDFGVGKRLQPVWYSEKNTKWGEDSLGTLSSIIPFISRDQLSLSVNITILKSEVHTMTPENPLETSPPFARYINSQEFSDVSFQVFEQEQEGEPQLFYGHKNILAAISPWFQMLFTNGMKESGQHEIKIRGVQHATFHRLLSYCYSFKINIDGVQDAYEMLKAADRFQIIHIREEALRYLRRELNEENIWEIWDYADIFGCEKTVDICKCFASAEMKTLIIHPSWLKAKAKVIKMALDIEIGALPEETELYEAILEWARIRGAPIKEKEVVEKPNASMTRTQLLSSVVNVEPLVISQAIIEEDEDDEEEEEVVVQSLALSDIDQKDAVVGETELVCDDDKKNVEIQVDPHDLALDLALILQCIRFPMMPPDYLANRVEADDYIMNIDGMKDMLYEAYKYHAVVGTASSFRCQPRRTQNESSDDL